jgi:hypothetical protein
MVPADEIDFSCKILGKPKRNKNLAIVTLKEPHLRAKGLLNGQGDASLISAYQIRSNLQIIIPIKSYKSV